MSSIEVDIARLRQHAETVRGVADGTAEAAAAGAHVTALDDAYGWTCQAMGLPAMLRGPQERGAQAISAITDVLRDDATNLAASADTYEQIDERLAELMRKIATALDKTTKAPKVGER